MKLKCVIMQVDLSTIKKIAHLSRLEFEEKEGAKMLESLNNILTWVEKLREVNIDNVEPLIHISEEVNVLRNDEVQPGLDHKKALVNAPKKDSDYFRVPKVLE